MTPINLTLYTVQNSDGKFILSKGRWTNDITKAKIYSRLGPARSVITFFAKHYPEFPVLKLIKFNITEYETVDDSERVEKALEKQAKYKANAKIREEKRSLKRAEEALRRAEESLARLKRATPA